MYLVGARGQQGWDNIFDNSSIINSASISQLALAQSINRSFLFIQNLSSSAAMYVEFGGARATCTISSGKVSTFTITNAGFGYTLPPTVEFIGGGNPYNSSFLGVAQPGYQAPSNPAKAHCVLTNGAVSSIVLDQPGSGYAIAPLVFLRNNPNDPFGAAIASGPSGIQLAANGGNILLNGTACPTDAISIFCGTLSQSFTVKYMP